MISLISTAQLIVRNIEEEVVEALKLRAARHGRSAEAEHRELLREALLRHDLTLVTRNVKHVERTGVRVLNPFEN